MAWCPPAAAGCSAAQGSCVPALQPPSRRCPPYSAGVFFLVPWYDCDVIPPCLASGSDDQDRSSRARRSRLGSLTSSRGDGQIGYQIGIVLSSMPRRLGQEHLYSQVDEEGAPQTWKQHGLRPTTDNRFSSSTFFLDLLSTPRYRLSFSSVPPPSSSA
jgi:hypothetical protein